MWAFFFFLNALCSAARIFFSSSEPEATSSERYSSTAAQPASDLSAILMSLFLRFMAFEAALRESSSLRINAETWWFSEFSRSTRDFCESTKERLWVMWKEDVSPACFARSVNYANLCSKWRSRSCPPAIFGPFSQVRISLQWAATTIPFQFLKTLVFVRYFSRDKEVFVREESS